MSGLNEGSTHALRSMSDPMYLKTADPGYKGGGTYTSVGETEKMQSMYENIFGPAGRDIKLDPQRQKRHQRWHPSDIRLPAGLRGRNDFLTERVDGLITDATNSPFTKTILPYVYLDYPDHKIKWNVYSFDEGIASRVPYESAARVLPQTKRSFAGYTVRQGLAIAMEHNFMVSEKGRENFQNQLTQLVGSIQMTNDLDVHIALLQAPSYQKHMNEKYHDVTKTTSQICRQYVDLFGILQKIPNALDILIEDAKNHLKTWGSQPPTFLLCNGNLTTQLTMLPEKTNYLTNGPDGIKRLAQGPDLPSYRGLSIINSRKFSMDAGTAPRDLLRRRVRVAEYYRIPGNKPGIKNMEFEFYDQSRDSWFRLSWHELAKMAELPYDGHPDGAAANMRPSSHGRWAPVAVDVGTSVIKHAQNTYDIGPLIRKIVRDVQTGGAGPWNAVPGVLVLHSPYGNGGVSKHRMRTNQLEPMRATVIAGQCSESSFRYGTSPATLHSVDESGKQREQAGMSETFGGMIWNDSFVSEPHNDRLASSSHLLNASWHTEVISALSTQEQFQLVYGILEVVTIHVNDLLTRTMVLGDNIPFYIHCRGMNLPVPDISMQNLLCATHAGTAYRAIDTILPMALMFYPDDISGVPARSAALILDGKRNGMMKEFLPRLAKLILMCGASPDTALNHVYEYTKAQPRANTPTALQDGTAAYAHAQKIVTGIFGNFNQSDMQALWIRVYDKMINPDGHQTFTGVDIVSNAPANNVPLDFVNLATTQSFESYWTNFCKHVVQNYKKGAGVNQNVSWMLVMLGVSAYLKILMNHNADNKQLVNVILDNRPDFMLKTACNGGREYEGVTVAPRFECMQHVYSSVSSVFESSEGYFYPSQEVQFPNMRNESLLSTTCARALDDIFHVIFTAAFDQVEQQCVARMVNADAVVDPLPFFGEMGTDMFQRAIIVDCIHHVLNTEVPYFDTTAGAMSENKTSVLGHLLNPPIVGDQTKYQETVFARTFAQHFTNAVGVEMQCRNNLSEMQLARHHDVANIMLATHDNSTKSHMKICAPNLHVSTWQPLNSEVISHMPAFAEPVQATLQHALSTMLLSSDVIAELLKETDNAVASMNAAAGGTDHLGAFLGGLRTDPNNSTQDMFNTRLMVTFLHLFHPSTHVRQQLRENAMQPTAYEQAQFCSALADALASNTRNAPELSQALAQLVADTSRGDRRPVCGFHCEQAATEQLALPAFMTEAQAQHDFGRSVPVQNLPLRQYSNLSSVCALPAQRLTACRETYMTQGGQAVPGVRGRMALPLFEQQVLGLPEQEIEVHDVYQNVRHVGWQNAQEQQGLFHATLLHPWVRSLPADTRIGTNKYMVPFDVRKACMCATTNFVDAHDPMASAYSAQTQQYLRNEHNCSNVWRTVVMILAQRCFRDTRRFCYDGQGVDAVESVIRTPAPHNNLALADRHQGGSGMVGGMPAQNADGFNGSPNVPALVPNQPRRSEVCVIRHGLHPCGFVPTVTDELLDGGGGGAGALDANELADCDIIVLRPNIEHEMLGIIMGRGGTQELGCTFWGQTELSCYDDAQHGVWGMSYKYHERAMVTNERNMIRTFDVAFDGYNGGMDDSFVDWKDPESIRRFTQATYARDRPYNGPSMLVMALPRIDTQRSFPNPIVFHTDTGGNLSPDPQKDEVLPDIAEFMVFNSKICPGFCQPAQELKYQEYMQKLGMFQWASVDQSSRPAGEACIANEATSNMLAFQGTMNIYDRSGNQRGAVMGSGHLGPSYVGVASVREGRGILNTHMQPQMIRQI